MKPALFIINCWWYNLINSFAALFVLPHNKHAVMIIIIIITADIKAVV